MRRASHFCLAIPLRAVRPDTTHWHGNTGLVDGRRVDVIGLLPAMAEVIDIQPDAPGTWMFHCHVNDHITAGMTALYRVREAD
ncbi:MAG: multicopper oxidase domain-containing protein [Rhodospirillales bacterium]|nr:multicopper oxidase domain-containing protein [Rhodospirillales bacterium]